MKRAALVLITVMIILALCASCNKNVCPAYVKDIKVEQVQNNG
jgi:hypothetical protein